MLPGFEKTDDIVGVQVDFDPIRLESNSQIKPVETELPGTYRIEEDSIDDIRSCLDGYYSKKPEIKEYSWGATIAFRAYEQDVNLLCKLLAKEINILVVSGYLGEEQVQKFSYSELIEGSEFEFDETEVDLELISDVRFDITESINDAIPDGITEVSFSSDQYFDFLNEYVYPLVLQANWTGGHAWLMNIGFRELRNGRYESAGYCFEGARIGLTKHSIFSESVTRLEKMVNRSLISLRELCFYQAELRDDLRGIELFCEIDNRDLIFIPEFTNTPELHDQHFRFANEIWIANALISIQAVAHAMESPTISRSEVDPFGSDLTLKNWSFALRASKALYETHMSDPPSTEKRVSYLDAMDFEEFAPEIILTRILAKSPFSITMYSNDIIETGDESVRIPHEFIVQQNDEYFIVRALRIEDRNPEIIQNFVENLENSNLDHKLMLIFQSELEDEVVEYFVTHELIEVFYVNLISERLSPLTSGYPESLQDFTTSEEIQAHLMELYEAVAGAETTEEKGETLEELMEFVFEKAIPDTRIRNSNVRTRVEEIDLQLINKERRYPWRELGSPINVECKNWSSPAGIDVIYGAFGKARATSPDCKGIILVCWEGVTDSVDGRYGDQAIREIRGKGVQILTLDKSDLSNIAETGDAQSVFEDKANELWDR